MRPVSARGGDRARQPGAARLGHHPLGQRLRGVGPPALPRAGEGALDPGRRVFRRNINKIFLQVANTLNMKFKASCGRGLTDENLKFLAGKAFR